MAEPKQNAGEYLLIAIGVIGAICATVWFIGTIAALRPDAGIAFQIAVLVAALGVLYAAAWFMGWTIRVVADRQGIPAPWRIVPEWRYGLLYRDGKFIRRIDGPERVWTWWRAEILYVINEEQIAALERRELISSDRLPFLVSAAVLYKVADPQIAVSGSQDYRAAFEIEAAAALTGFAASRPLGQLLDDRRHLDTLLHAALVPTAQARGIAVSRTLITEFIVHPEILLSLGRDGDERGAPESMGTH